MSASGEAWVAGYGTKALGPESVIYYRTAGNVAPAPRPAAAYRSPASRLPAHAGAATASGSALPLLEEQGHRIQQLWPPGSPARLQIIEHARHNPHAEQPAEVMQAVRDFISE